MNWNSGHPVLEEGIWDRKAGRHDFERFDHRTSTSWSIANQSIGDVDVDCRFHFKDSRWGTLGKEKIDAGIIHMEINFNQPRGHRLEWARIQLTLDEDDPSVGTNEDDRRLSEVPVHITDYYGPQRIVGIPKSTQVQKSLEVGPSVEFGGIGVSLGKYTLSKQFEHESLWTFHSYKVQSRDRQKRKADKILRWELFEKDVERDPIHKNQVFTAFAYEYSGQPFLMKLEISGRLSKLRHRMKGKRHRMKDALKFGPRTGKKEDVATTLIKQYIGEKLPLDEHARALEAELAKKNSRTSTRELPDIRAPSPLRTKVGGDGAPLNISRTDETTLQDGRPDPLLEELAIVAAGPKVLMRHQAQPRSEAPSEDHYSHTLDHGSSGTPVSCQIDGIRLDEDATVDSPDSRKTVGKLNLPIKSMFKDYMASFCWLLLYSIRFFKIGWGGEGKEVREQ